MPLLRHKISAFIFFQLLQQLNDVSILLFADLVIVSFKSCQESIKKLYLAKGGLITLIVDSVID